MSRTERETPPAISVAKTDDLSTHRRQATVYDAVASRVGLNGFLNASQRHSLTSKPLKPEEVLLRRVDAPVDIPFNYYNAHTLLEADRTLPDSDLLKDIHVYAADFYDRISRSDKNTDFRSLDETALLAIGILLEEASKECLGETGDMVFTEARSADHTLQGDVRQIVGTVVPERVQEYESASENEDSDVLGQQPRKRRRRRYDDS